MNLDAARKAEHAKYERAYAAPNYHMGQRRMTDAVNDLRALPVRGAYLDVGCGCGEMLDHAAGMGFAPVKGTEIVPALIDGVRVVRAEVHALPFGDASFDVATMFDVIEHLIPGDDDAACRELARVARRHIILTASNLPSFSEGGDDLHINRREYPTWNELFVDWFAPALVTHLSSRNPISETWRVDL